VNNKTLLNCPGSGHGVEIFEVETCNVQQLNLSITNSGRSGPTRAQQRVLSNCTPIGEPSNTPTRSHRQSCDVDSRIQLRGVIFDTSCQLPTSLTVQARWDALQYRIIFRRLLFWESPAWHSAVFVLQSFLSLEILLRSARWCSNVAHFGRALFLVHTFDKAGTSKPRSCQ
jgi:hypothetical protein